jgi:hypothetical protein
MLGQFLCMGAAGAPGDGCAVEGGVVVVLGAALAMLMPAPPAMPIDPPSATAANRGLSFKVPPLSTWIENTEAIS